MNTEGDLCGYDHPPTSGHAGILSNAQCEETSDRTAPWPNRAEMGVQLFKNFLLALVDTASKAAKVRNTQVTLSCETAMEVPWDED